MFVYRSARLGAAVLAAGLIACPSRPAVGQAPPPAPTLEDGAPPLALHRYRLARELYAKGNVREALAELQVAYRLFPTSRKLAYNLARSHERLEMWADALTFYRRYLELTPDAPDRSDVEAIAFVLEQRIAPKGTAVDIRTDPPGAEILLDDKPMGKSPTTLSVPPGEHSLRLRLQGHEEARRPISVVAGRAIALEVALPAIPPPASAPAPLSAPAPSPPALAMDTVAPAPAGSSRPSWASPVGWSAVGLGVAGAAIGVFGYVQASDASGKIDRLSLGDRGRYDDLQGEVDTGNALGVAGLVSAVVLGAGGALLLLWPFAGEPVE